MNAAAPIPIENVYYLFCYAWNRFYEAQSIPVGSTLSPDLPSLLAKVLLSGTRALLRRGLDRNYQYIEEEIATVRGHIDLGTTLRLQARNIRQLYCTFDELSHDVVHNRILKASLKRLAQAPKLAPDLSHELRALARHLSNVTDIPLQRSVFRRVQLHRNNAYYDFLLRVAELAFDCLLPDPHGTGFVFHDVLRDERKMAGVFEEFVRNFYRLEQRCFSVKPLTIKWDATALVVNEASRLPNMVVDVFLHHQDRKIIIDTKYYARALQTRHGSESYHSGNLYQLFSYLKNVAARDPTLKMAEGILLYPQVQQSLDASYLIQGHLVTVATIDLTQPWSRIADRLLKLLAPRGASAA